MHDNKLISIETRLRDIQMGLSKIIKGEHAALISKVILDHLATTELGVEQLCLAMAGIRVSAPYKVGDEVGVFVDMMPSWKFDRLRTEEAGLVFKGCVKGLVTTVDNRKKSNITVQTLVRDISGNELLLSFPYAERYLYTISEDFMEEDLSKEEELPF